MKNESNYLIHLQENMTYPKLARGNCSQGQTSISQLKHWQKTVSTKAVPFVTVLHKLTKKVNAKQLTCKEIPKKERKTLTKEKYNTTVLYLALLNMFVGNFFVLTVEPCSVQSMNLNRLMNCRMGRSRNYSDSYYFTTLFCIITSVNSSLMQYSTV